MKKWIIFLSGVLGVFLFALASILGGLQIEGYSFVSQYISEGFADGLPNTGHLRLMFVVGGCFLAVFGFLVPSVLHKSKTIKIGFWLFAIFYGFGTITVALFPCDFGCPTNMDGASISQFIHNTTAFFTYIFTPLSIIGIGVSLQKELDVSRLSKVSLILGSLALAFVFFLFTNPTGPYIGLFQIIVELSILGWVTYSAFHIRNSKNRLV